MAVEERPSFIRTKQHRALTLAASVLLGLVVLDVMARGHNMKVWDAASWVGYSLSLLLGALGTLAGALVLWKLTSTSRIVAGSCVGVGATLLAALAALSTGYFNEFREYPSWSEAVFLMEEASHGAETMGLLQGALCPSVGVAVLVVASTGLLGWLWVVRGEHSLAPKRRRDLFALAVGSVLLLALRVSLPSVAVASPPLINEVVNAGLLAKYYTTRTRGVFHDAHRDEVPKLEPPPAQDGLPERPNVLLLVQESLSRGRMSLYGYERPTTPRLASFAAERRDELFVFDRAITNSSNTSVSVPTILLGLPPDAEPDVFHRAPSVWQFAKAAGYETFLLSAQSFRYANLDRFLLTTPPDDRFTAEQGAELVNGGGMDDEVFLERVLDKLSAQRSRTAPFFGVVQFNATHYPFLERPPLAPEFDTSTRVGRYDNAVRVLDDVLARLFAHLASTGQLETTLILMTADHGENHGEHDVHRTQSFYEEVAGIPFLVFVPKQHATLSAEQLETLRGNLHQRVQNLDVVPTLLDAMGIPDAAPYTKFRAWMPGQSLFRPVAPDRVIVARNVVPIRRWSNEGFGLTRDNERYIFTEWQLDGLFDLSRDPKEENNLIQPGTLPRWVEETLAKRPDLRQLRQRFSKERPFL